MVSVRDITLVPVNIKESPWFWPRALKKNRIAKTSEHRGCVPYSMIFKMGAVIPAGKDDGHDESSHNESEKVAEHCQYNKNE